MIEMLKDAMDNHPVLFWCSAVLACGFIAAWVACLRESFDMLDQLGEEGDLDR